VTVIEEQIRKARHNLRGRLNAVKLCISALEILEEDSERIEFLDMIIESVDNTVAALEEFEAASDRAGPS
jgi:hypothetical protein